MRYVPAVKDEHVQPSVVGVRLAALLVEVVVGNEVGSQRMEPERQQRAAQQVEERLGSCSQGGEGRPAVSD